MAGKRDIGFVCDAIVNQLRADMPAKVDEINTEYADGVRLEQVPNKNYYVSERRIPATPMVAAIASRTSAMPDSGESRYNMQQHFVTVTTAVSAVEDEDNLKRRSVRMVRAVEEVFLNAITLGGSVDDIVILSKEYGDMLSDDNALLQESQVLVRCRTSQA